MSETEAFEGWCVLELFGHRRLAGYVRGQEIAGASFLRIDVPGAEWDRPPRATQFYSAAAIYALTPTTEAIARAFAEGHQPEPVTRWELPAPCGSVEGRYTALDEHDPDDPGEDGGEDWP